jgi:replicative DNA helicase
MNTNHETKYLTYEDSVVCIILDNPDIILTQPIETRWFTKNRPIIEVMLKLAGEGVHIDVFSVSQPLHDSALNNLIDIQKNHYSSKENYTLYLDGLRKQFESRELRNAIVNSIAEIDEGTQSDEVLANLLTSSMAIVSPNGVTYTHTIKQSAQLFFDHLDEVLDAKDNGGMGIKTGIKTLDEVMGNMHAPDLVVVGARPATGKSAMALCVLRNIAKKGKRVGFFSTEMSTVQVMGRFYALESGISAFKLRYADLDDSDYAKLTRATNVVTKLDFQICDKPAITVQEIAMQARAWASNGGLDFIAIDYLTRIRLNKSLGSQNLDIGYIATELKNLARTLDIPVMVLAQLNRGSANRADERPRMADLRDSGIIEQEADQILLLHRPEDGQPEIIISKNRHGEIGTVRCLFDKPTMRWSDATNNDYY